ncbi:MAG: type I-C CRISPR-associated protein Cas8c/Csd1 [Dehalococcoidia bacterium]|nr:type I-C CRISPR-associated protein Cas8c/Csd1 [Dehalococcoidia bacterium]MYG19886.1 type I-C CRISPR-associated protein Cas8c/Csd1 [Gemmatimonadales bacterium]
MTLLSKLKEYADERLEDQLPPLYANTPVAWIVMLDSDGRVLSPHPISRTDPSTTRGKRGIDMAAPEVQRAAGIKPLLLADNGEYTFGRARDPAKQVRVDQAHAEYRELIDRCAVATEEPAVLAVKRFYERGGADQLTLGDEWDYGLKVTFEVALENGEFQRPIDLPSVQAFWLASNTPDSATEDQCLVCGKSKPVLDRLQAKIKGIRGAQSSGTSIISANSSAFESYGLEASRIAPTCRECGESFTRALNSLLADERTSLTVADTTFAFWTRAPVAFDFGSHMRQPDPSQVQALVDSPRVGRRATIEDETAFYAASLSASGGRAVVRDWIDTTVGSVEDSVARWFRLQRISDPRDEDPQGTHPRPLSLFQLAASTVRDARSDLPVTTPRSLFRAALSATPLPLDLAFQAVRRCRAEQGVTRPRAALIKLVLMSRETTPPKEDYMVALETEHPSPAYHCGRLLAVIEDVQRAALPGVNATIVDRYYGAASSTPAVVFGALLRGAQPHLARLERDRPGAYVNLQRRLEEVMARIGDWPATLALKEQALFSLGYYHQRAHSRAEMASRRASRDAESGVEDPKTDTGQEHQS